jgi:hypothetical protein
MMNRALALTFVLAVSACAEPGATGPGSFTPASDGISKGLTFVAVRRSHAGKDGVPVVTSGNQTQLDLQGDEDNFYLAVHKSALTKKYFMSAYLKQLFPGAVSYGAATSLGTKIVQLKPQNGKLYAFSADNIKKTSDTFNPDLIVDAYPIVTDFDAFNKLDNAGEYYLIDPTAGQNRFNMFSDMNAEWGARFETELTYGQRFRKIADGMTFELVFTGYADSPDFNSWQYGETNTLKGSGTLGFSIREYKESDGFQAAPYNPHYFYSDVQLVANTGQLDAPSAKWNIYNGMKPIVWKLSPQFAEVAQNPKYADLDIVGAVKAGVERWNEVFGFEALKAEVAGEDESFADDDVNYLIYDKDPTFGAAFANWRTNPNTGEIRGASVYFNAIWLDAAAQAAGIKFDDKSTERVKSEMKRSHPVLSLAWGGMNESRLCTYKVKERMKPKQNALAKDDTDPAQKNALFKEFITHVVLHEIGHTLGLRHNFAGSLLPPSSSVMDYLTDEDSVVSGHPGAYDTAALQALYGLSKEQPKQPFCTDENIADTAYCAPFDSGADPLKVSSEPNYDWLTREMLNPDSILMAFLGRDLLMQYWEYYLTDVLKFARDPSSQQQEEALTDVLAVIGEGKADDPSLSGSQDQLDTINAMTQVLFKQAFLSGPKAWGQIAVALPTTGPLFQRYLLPELAGALSNEDGLRSASTRRMSVDALKAVQTSEGLLALQNGKASLEAELKGLTGAELLEQQDLIARIQAATSPYFK